MKALRRIAAQVRELAGHAGQDDYRVEPADLTLIARRFEAQAEMIEQGMVDAGATGAAGDA